MLRERPLLDAIEQVLAAPHVQRDSDPTDHLQTKEGRHPLGSIWAPEDDAIPLQNPGLGEIRGCPPRGCPQLTITPGPLLATVQRDSGQVNPPVDRSLQELNEGPHGALF